MNKSSLWQNLLRSADLSEHQKGLWITTIGVLFVVPDSLFIRLIDATAWTVTFWRGTLSGLIVLLVIAIFMGRKPFYDSFRTGYSGLIYTVLIALSAPSFVLAVKLTSVANVVLIIASMPVFAAIFSRLFLREPITRRMVLTIIGVFLGLSIVAFGSSVNEQASWQGDLVAVCVSASFAGAMTAARKLRAVSMVPAIPVAYVLGALIVAPFAEPFSAFAAQPALILLHGSFIACSSVFLTLGPRYISSGEVALLILLETALAPLLVWVAVGEYPGQWALFGGFIVIGVLVASNIFLLRQLSGRR